MTRTLMTPLAGMLLLAAPWLATLTARAQEQPQPTTSDTTYHRVFWTSGDAQQKAVQYIQSRRAHHDAFASLQQCQTCHDGMANYLSFANAQLNSVRLSPAEGPWVGVTVGPADDVLRSQLRLPEGTGVVITQVLADGPASRSGVAEHDILLSVNGQPVASGDALDALVKAWKPESAPLTLKLLREGQPLEKQVTPSVEPQGQFLRLLSHVMLERPYRIGVSVSAPDETLRKQLKLGEAGVVVTAVAGGSPAEKQGVKVNDVLTAVNHKPLKEPDELTGAVQGAAESPVELELLRGGVSLKLSVTPEKQPPTSAEVALDLAGALEQQRELTLVHSGLIHGLAASNAPPATQPVAADDGRMERISVQLEELKAAVEALRAEVKGGR